MAQVIARMALAALGLSDASFHETFHADGRQRPMAITERSDQNPRCGGAAHGIRHLREDGEINHMGLRVSALQLQ